MRHLKKKGKLNKSSSHVRSMFNNMSVSLILNEQIKTTLVKAKHLRSYIEPLITLSKEDNLHSRRRFLSKMGFSNKSLLKLVTNKLFNDLGKKYFDRAGGYTRIVKTGFRKGDRADMAIIEFVDRNIEEKGKYNNI